jgi:hypothetical protein
MTKVIFSKDRWTVDMSGKQLASYLEIERL